MIEQELETPQGSEPRSRWRTIAAGLFVVPAFLVITTWAIGLVCGDRWAWSQWLQWIPSLPAMISALILLALLPRRTVRRRLIIVLSLIVLCVGVVRDYRILPPRLALHNNSFTIAHWNAYEGAAHRDVDATAGFAVSLQADILILTSAHHMVFHTGFRDAIGEDMFVVGLHPFVVVSSQPIVNHGRLLKTNDICIERVVIDGSRPFDQLLTIDIVDLPSDPKLPRMEMARSIRAKLDALDIPPADIVVGDFNIPRGAASLDVMFPGMHHAWTTNGRGVGASFPRQYPLWHIDHMLVSPELLSSVEDYELVTPTTSRHRAQRMYLFAPWPQTNQSQQPNE